ncbi:unnamed protein product [Protopolystoma xenopodis]|uniref:Uncharacterized protein n=1 Tax=Protopolystoma xenopodis TaxID=117903 RepID=A0A448WCE5_9PLAT|nr:unnamed protein product [Protopolystoma xenopodis]
MFELLCFKAAWMMNVLHIGLEFPEDYSKLRPINDLNGAEVQWSLGALLHLLRFYPLKFLASADSTSAWPFSLIMLVTFGFLLFIIIGIAISAALRRRRRLLLPLRGLIGRTSSQAGALGDPYFLPATTTLHTNANVLSASTSSTSRRPMIRIRNWRWIFGNGRKPLDLERGLRATGCLEGGTSKCVEDTGMTLMASQPIWGDHDRHQMLVTNGEIEAPISASSGPLATVVSDTTSNIAIRRWLPSLDIDKGDEANALLLTLPDRFLGSSDVPHDREVVDRVSDYSPASIRR